MSNANHQFDKALLFITFLVIVLVIVFRSGGSTADTAGLLHWLREQGSLVLGALIAIITGAATGAAQAAYNRVTATGANPVITASSTQGDDDKGAA